MEKYRAYTKNDFLDDPDFIRHVKYPEEDLADQWNDWLAQRPPNEEAYREAVFLLRGMLGTERLQPGILYADRLFADIKGTIALNDRKNRKRKIIKWSLSGIAATFLLLLTAFWYLQSMINIQTGNGELLSATLPDKSMVQLNANSSIRYHRAWKLLGKREVWMSGEVLFDVKHLNKNPREINEGERFTTYSGDIAIEVLGTKFNVKNRRKEISVALLDGKVNVRSLDGKGRSRSLKPGELIRYRKGNFTAIEKTAAQNAKPTSWINKEVVAFNMQVADLVEEYRNVYGKEIVVTDTSLLTKRIDGKLSTRSEESIVYTLANILDATIRYGRDTIYLDSKQTGK